MEATVSLSRKQ